MHVKLNATNNLPFPQPGTDIFKFYFYYVQSIFKAKKLALRTFLLHLNFLEVNGNYINLNDIFTILLLKKHITFVERILFF